MKASDEIREQITKSSTIDNIVRDVAVLIRDAMEGEGVPRIMKEVPRVLFKGKKGFYLVIDDFPEEDCPHNVELETAELMEKLGYVERASERVDDLGRRSSDVEEKDKILCAYIWFRLTNKARGLYDRLKEEGYYTSDTQA